MDAADYQTQAMTLRNKDLGTRDYLLNALLGLGGEVGEIQDAVKKALFQGHELDKPHLERELGDVLWYCALLAETIGTDLGVAMQVNLAKLRARYPQGFDAAKSIQRAPESAPQPFLASASSVRYDTWNKEKN